MIDPYQQNDQAPQQDKKQHSPDILDGNFKGKIYRPRERVRNKTINPLYIAVPVAGACVLLAIIIFAIYILKRQNALMAEYHQNHLKQQHNKLCHPIYQGGVKLQGHHLLPQQQQKLLPHHHPSPHPTSAPTSGDRDLLSVHSTKSYPSDCSSERSSTGSETKLLMKV